jgi:hypothetical protein
MNVIPSPSAKRWRLRMLKDVMTEDEGKRREVESGSLPNIFGLKKSRTVRWDEHV